MGACSVSQGIQTSRPSVTGREYQARVGLTSWSNWPSAKTSMPTVTALEFNRFHKLTPEGQDFWTPLCTHTTSSIPVLCVSESPSE